MSSKNPFTILNSAPNDALRNVLVDLDIEADNLDEQIDLFKAEELLRTDLSQANHRDHLDRINKKNAPPRMRLPCKNWPWRLLIMLVGASLGRTM